MTTRSAFGAHSQPAARGSSPNADARDIESRDRHARSAGGPGFAIRTIALVEGAKGVAVLLVASGLLAFVHHDLNAMAVRLVEHAHLNPASKLPHIFLDAVSHVDQPRLLLLALGAAAYAALRLLEAYGLFRGRAWAEWLSALSGAIYVPFEIVEIIRDPTPLTWGLLAVNVAVVVVMARALWQRRMITIAGAAPRSV